MPNISHLKGKNKITAGQKQSGNTVSVKLKLIITASNCNKKQSNSRTKKLINQNHRRRIKIFIGTEAAISRSDVNNHGGDFMCVQLKKLLFVCFRLHNDLRALDTRFILHEKCV